MHQDQQHPSPEDQEFMDRAKEDEVAALSEYLQSRVLFLNVEVRRRDARIHALEAALAAASQGQAEGPWGAVSEGGPDAQPQ